jgi:hypothetical protein
MNQNDNEILKKDIKEIIRKRLEEVGIPYIDEDVSDSDDDSLVISDKKTPIINNKNVPITKDSKELQIAQENAELERMKKELDDRKRVNQQELETYKTNPIDN